MRSNMQKWSKVAYCSSLALLGIFYLLANFPKEFSHLWGLVVLVIALVALILTVLNKNTILMVFFGMFIVVQLPPLFFWLTFPDMRFEILGQYFAVGWLGFAAHLAAACWGTFLLVRNIK